MEVIIRGNPKEIAALAAETQERPKTCSVVITAHKQPIAKAVFEAIRGMQSEEVQGRPAVSPTVLQISGTKLATLLREGLKGQPVQEPESSTEPKTEQKDES